MTCITTGQITTRRDARVHLAIDGRIADGNRPITHPNQAGKLDTSRLCRRCWTPARITTAQKLLTATPGRVAEAIRKMLSHAADAIASPAERAELDDLAARIANDLAAKQVAEACAQDPAGCAQTLGDQRKAGLRRILDARVPRQLSGLGALAAAHRVANARPRVTVG